MTDAKEKAIEAAAMAIFEKVNGHGRRWQTIDHKAAYREQARASIDAYEAALWRPIEEAGEAPSIVCDGRTIVLASPIGVPKSIWETDSYSTLEPTHFRPLPDPPKGSET